MTVLSISGRKALASVAFAVSAGETAKIQAGPLTIDIEFDSALAKGTGPVVTGVGAAVVIRLPSDVDMGWFAGFTINNPAGSFEAALGYAAFNTPRGQAHTVTLTISQ